MLRTLSIVFLFVVLMTPGARADDDGGLFMKSYGHVGLVYESGERGGRSGLGVYGYAEGMIDDLVTQLDHRAGLEGSIELGWAKYADPSDNFAFGAQGPLHFDMAFGFPLSLVEFGRGSPWGVRLQVSPGAGVSIQHVYAYLRGRFTLRLAGDYGLDVSYKWTPSRASYAWADRTGLSAGTLRATVHAAIAPVSLLFFAELAQAKTEVMTQGPLHPVERARYQNIVRLGAGWVF